MCLNTTDDIAPHKTNILRRSPASWADKYIKRAIHDRNSTHKSFKTKRSGITLYDKLTKRNIKPNMQNTAH